MKVHNCLGVFKAAAGDKRLTAAKRRQCDRIARAMVRHPRLGVAVQARLLHAYEKENGMLVGAIPWLAIFEWLIANGPAIIKMILSLLALFGL